MTSWRFLDRDDPSLAPSDDPGVARAQLLEARLSGDSALAVREQCLALLDEHGRALADRRTGPAHLTASSVVIADDGQRVAVMLHTKLRRWLQPGGHADGDLNLAGVALREATEETGISGLALIEPAVDLDVHRVDHGDALGEHLHLDLRFVVVAPAGATLAGNHESTELRWVTPSELAALTDEEGLARLVRAGLSARQEAVGAADELS